MVSGVGVSCRILYSIINYLYVSCSGSITSVGEERESLFVCYRLLVIIWLLFVEVLFLLVPGVDYVILLWHSLDLPYNYFVVILHYLSTIFCPPYNILARYNYNHGV